jgi:tetratricopeptide (TPR) repeat protein
MGVLHSVWLPTTIVGMLAIGSVVMALSPAVGQTDARSRCSSTTLSNDESIAGCNEAIRANPRDATLWYNRGVSWSNKGDYDRAIADYNEAIRLNPKHARAYNNRGNAWKHKRDYDRAIADFNEAIRLDPKDAPAYNNRGNTWDDKENYDRAIADYNEAIRLNPKYARAYNNRGVSWANKRQYDRAIADYNEALKLDPQYLAAYNNRGNAWKNKGEYDLAIADFDEANRLAPDYANAYYNRGLAWEKKNEFRRALGDFQRFAELAPSDPDGPAAVARMTAALEKAISQSRPQQLPTPAPPGAIAPATADRRVALLIGNSSYQNAPSLNNPVNDARAIATSLRTAGFQTTTVKTDLTREQIISALRDFANVADSADWAVVYYSGHGIEFGGTNYMVPVDARLRVDRDIDLETVDVGKVLSSIEGAKRLRLVILDACRDNPFVSQMRRTMATRSLGRGLARIEPEAGTLIVYAAKHGETALDGDGMNSPFVSALIRRIPTPNLEIRRLFDLVRDDVMDATRKKQQPFSYGSLSGSEDYYFIAR